LFQLLAVLRQDLYRKSIWNAFREIRNSLEAIEGLRTSCSCDICFFCGKLRNYIIESKGCYITPPPSTFDQEYHTVSPDRSIYLQNNCDLSDELRNRHRDYETPELRSMMTQFILHDGLRRPT